MKDQRDPVLDQLRALRAAAVLDGVRAAWSTKASFKKHSSTAQVPGYI